MKSVLNQIKVTCGNGNRRAACIGFVLGGIIPALTFFVDRYEIQHDASLLSQIPTYLVLGGMTFSAKTVFEWAKLAFYNTFKAFGFVVLLEGAMIFSGLFPLAVVALVVLVTINGTVTDWRREQLEMKSTKTVARKNVTAIKKAA